MEALSLRLSIRSESALIGIQTQLAKVEIEQPHGDLSIQTVQPQFSAKSGPGKLTIDSSKAWEALGVGSNLAFMSSIYQQSMDNVKNQIAEIVEDGNEMADISNHQNAIANIAARKFPVSDPISYVGEASVLNVKINYDPTPPQIEFTPGKAQIEYTPRPAQIAYERGKVTTSIRRPNSIDIRVTEYGINN